MNKITKYLNEHILGEATSSLAARRHFERDGSILSITPDIVVMPRVTNDIRKIARFSWQLAEKGHILPITTRGGGTDQTGAAIGKGIMIDTKTHLNKILYFAPNDKQHIVHVQPGVTFQTLNSILEWHGLYVPSYPSSSARSTVGGAVANNAAGQFSGAYGSVGDWVTRLEVVLANGDIIETSRISKRDLNKKKGLQTLEGEIYRKIDGLIEDYQELINEMIASDTRDNTGYSGIAKVKQRDGSFDLTPLFIGSQGTLGIISEIVLKTAFYSSNQTILVAVLPSLDVARDAVDDLRKLEPVSIDIFDGQIFEEARTKGKHFPALESNTDKYSTGAVVFTVFSNFSSRTRQHKIKRAIKALEKLEATIINSDENDQDDLSSIREVAQSTFMAESTDDSYPPLVDGAMIPSVRQGEFISGVAEIAHKYHLSLPLQIKALDNTFYTRPRLKLRAVSDKQKVFKLISEYTNLVAKCDGNMLADSAEGRLKSYAVYKQIDKEVLKIYEQVRSVFDPYNTLNPGVKQMNELKELVSLLRSDYSLADLID